MKTLVLLSALVLLAILGQADALPEATEETKNEDQPGVEDQDVSISFGGPVGDALQDADPRKIPMCFCRKRTCRFLERPVGKCGKGSVFCCR
ncbi:alpha-defensin 3-like [Peromyscus maniculatus bairdii]|uniref:Alpha-defensin N-terminal domain-containing protein n=1 Tax=Peromyscus maniculatus bairdii TaxID=230844 RepID=A0A8C8W351_PERMB|nr:alpha-defensin 3-like [Peromyscus maniculatus bairdii]